MALTKIPGTDIARGVGRPNLHVRETKVRLTDEQRKRIEALVGRNHMSSFIREAIEEALARRERNEAKDG